MQFPTCDNSKRRWLAHEELRRMELESLAQPLTLLNFTHLKPFKKVLVSISTISTRKTFANIELTRCDHPKVCVSAAKPAIRSGRGLACFILMEQSLWCAGLKSLTSTGVMRSSKKWRPSSR